MTKKHLLASIIVVFCTFINVLNAQKYSIEFKIDEIPDTLIYLAHYYGDRQFADDTAYINENGIFKFEGDKKLQEGMYLIAGSNNTKYLDFFIDDEQSDIKIAFNPYDLVNTAKAVNSTANTMFFDYIKFIDKKYREKEEILKISKKPGLSEDSLEILKARLAHFNVEVEEYIDHIQINHPKSFVPVFILSNIEADYLDLAKKYADAQNKEVDSIDIYFAYKIHFFDNFNFNDDRMLYTPNFISRVDDYLNRLAVPIVDSLNKEVDYLLSRASRSDELKKYLAWHLVVKYETSRVMGQDAVFVHIVNNYLRDGKIGWLYPEISETVIQKVDKIQNLLIGCKAPNLILLDTADVAHSIYDFDNDFLILYFWNTDCWHCEEEAKKAIEFYKRNKTKYNLEIVGICTTPDIGEMKSYMKEFNLPWLNLNGHKSLQGNYFQLYDITSTPIMYMLDKDKKILTKFLLTTEIQQYLDREYAE